RLVVTEVNVAPTLAALEDVTLHFDVPLTVMLTGADVDLPANRLRYALDLGPAGMAVDATTGRLTWTPGSAQVGSHPVTVSVTDDGLPALSAARSFTVTVTGEGATLTIDRLAGTLTQVSAGGDVGATYELEASGDMEAWERLIEFQMGATPYRYIDPASATLPVRFYRLRLKQQ
ncbi:MAG: Ig domain-containing protein, partial [Legionella sp.]|nr:Ig domain-containing protein [Legionella sp.]